MVRTTRTMGDFPSEVNLIGPYSYLNVQVNDFALVTEPSETGGFPSRRVLNLKTEVGNRGRTVQTHGGHARSVQDRELWAF